MPDHLHFILLMTGGNNAAALPEMIKWFKTQTTNDYIRQVKAGRFPPFENHIWQRGYYEHVIRNEDDLYETRKYISENPARWAYRYLHTENGQD